MISKESLHLGQKVWYGAEKVEAVVDGITRTCVGLVLKDGGYILAKWEEICS